MKCYVIDCNSKIYGEASDWKKAEQIRDKVIQKYLDREWTEEEIEELELEVIKC